MQRKTPTQRAYEELARRHLPEFLQLKREERDKDRQNGQGQAGISAVEPVAEPAQRQRRRGGGYSSQIATA